MKECLGYGPKRRGKADVDATLSPSALRSGSPPWPCLGAPSGNCCGGTLTALAQPGPGCALAMAWFAMVLPAWGVAEAIHRLNSRSGHPDQPPGTDHGSAVGVAPVRRAAKLGASDGGGPGDRWIAIVVAQMED